MSFGRCVVVAAVAFAAAAIAHADSEFTATIEELAHDIAGDVGNVGEDIADMPPKPLKDTPWPWWQWCNQSLTHLNNNTGCNVEKRSDFPALVSGTTYDIYYGSHILSAGGSVAQMLSLRHSMILIREIGNTSGLDIIIEYAAVDFGPDAIIPKVFPNGTLSWKVDGVIAWFPEANQSKWVAEANITHIGSITDQVLDKWFSWAADWRHRHDGYQVWSVWDHANVTSANKLFKDSICHTFTEDSLVSFYELGADFHQMKPLCRNYFPFLSNSTPELVNMTDEAEKADLLGFYDGIDKILRMNYTNMTDFDNTMRDFLNNSYHHIYIYQLVNGEHYWRAKLHSPWLARGLYQPMLLPWQKTEDLEKWSANECNEPDSDFPPSAGLLV